MSTWEFQITVHIVQTQEKKVQDDNIQDTGPAYQRTPPGPFPRTPRNQRRRQHISWRTNRATRLLRIGSSGNGLCTSLGIPGKGGVRVEERSDHPTVESRDSIRDQPDGPTTAMSKQIPTSHLPSLHPRCLPGRRKEPIPGGGHGRAGREGGAYPSPSFFPPFSPFPSFSFFPFFFPLFFFFFLGLVSSPEELSASALSSFAWRRAM